MKRRTLFAIAFAASASLAASALWAHCQVPCGIYNDQTRLALMEEHVTTIEKSMREIDRLSSDAGANMNQLVRWVNNKDAHADKLTEIVTAYFMAQRIKPAAPEDKAKYGKYVRELTMLHRMMMHAMKAKQTTDPQHCNELRKLIAEFRASYLGKQASAH